jgi:tetratricopeptide (TPR) repeat protein
VQLLKSESVDIGLDPLEALDVQLIADPIGNGVVRFRHALLQEAAYQSLPFRQRLLLHQKVGEVIETGGPETGDVAALLSYHFLAAQDWERTWRYARNAAHIARTAHALTETVVHLERAVTASRRLGDVASGELAAVLGELGLSLELLGEYERADDAYRRASTSETDSVERGQVAYRRAHLRSEYLGRPGAAIRLLRSARTNLDCADDDAAGLRALLLAEEAYARQRQGRLSEAIECAGRAAEEAERSNQKRALAIALHVRNISFGKGGQLDKADSMDQALELFEELGDEVSVALTLGNIALIAFYSSQWEKAARYLTLCAESSTKAGDLGTAASTNANLGELRTDQGRLEEAVALLVPARRTLESFGYAGATASAAAQLGRAMAFLGDSEGGLALLRAAVATLDEIGAQYEALEANTRLAEILVFVGRLTEARSALQRARDLERGVGHTPLGPLIERVELTIAASGEGVSPASLESFLERARRDGAAYDELVVLALAERSGDRTQHEHIARLAQALDVVQLPMFVGG